MTIIQLLLIAFAVFGMVSAARKFRRGGLTFPQLLLWSLVWLGVVAVVLKPETASALARALGVGRGADVVVYLALAAAFYMLFKLFAKIEDLERQITKVVRQLALKDLTDSDHE